MICSNCIYDSKTPEITFNQDGVCNYCLQVDALKREYGTGGKLGQEKFEAISQKIKRDGEGKRYDCIVGVSGGTDSSYMLHLMKQKMHRPLAVHYDNTWNSSVATQNIQKITKNLNIDLYTHVVNNKEIDDIYRSFFLASVPAIDVATDLALTRVLYDAAIKYKVNYVIEGHSFITEGISPPSYSYFDGKYIKNVHDLYGHQRMETFPNMMFLRFLYYTLYKRIKKIRPLWYVDYSKEEAKELLKNNYGWEDYGGHHLENQITAFSHSYHNYKKFAIDQRNNSLSASVRAGKISQKEALDIYSQEPSYDKNLVEYTKKRLGFSDDQFKQIMEKENKSWKNYKNYKKLFEFLRPLFYVLSRFELVPRSFYLKYCFPIKNYE